MLNQFFGEEGAKRVARLVVIALALFSLFLLLKVVKDFKQLPNVGREVYPQSTISVAGSGEVYAVPDIAVFSFSVIESASTVTQAQQKADTKMNAALSAVRETGVEEKDIKTTGYNVYPKYEYSNAVCPANQIMDERSSVIYCPPGKQVLTGYEVSQTVSVKIRDTEKAGDLVTKVGATGASNISGVEFMVDDRDTYVAQAREQAIAEAKEKAKVLAKQLGVRLGKILYYNENGPYPMYYADGKGGAEMGISSVAPARAELPKGETKITSDISITYEIR